MGRPTIGEPPHERVRAPFREGVVRAGPYPAHPSRDGSAHHNSSLAAFHHFREEGARQVDWAPDVDRESSLEQRIPANVQPVAVGTDGRRVHQPVNGADLGRERLDGGAIARVEAVDLGFVRGRADAASHARHVSDVDESDLGAHLRAEPSRGPADPAGGAGYENSSAAQIERRGLVDFHLFLLTAIPGPRGLRVLEPGNRQGRPAFLYVLATERCDGDVRLDDL